MKTLRRIPLTILISLTITSGVVQAVEAPTTTTVKLIEHNQSITPRSSDLRTDNQIRFRHGDISWLPELAAEAGWLPEHIDKLGHIILRESGGCPTRIGSSIVDKNCNIIGYTTATNKSDSGLLQINYVNYDSKRIGRPAFLCKKIQVCTQEQLLDPLTNLQAGKALYDEAGWSPWDVCAWQPTAKQCKP